MKNVIISAVLLAVFSSAGMAETVDLFPAFAEKPFTYASKPNEFAGRSDAWSISFPADGAELFEKSAAFGKDGAFVVRIRATNPHTDAVEFTFHQNDGKVWGTTSLSIDPEWNDVLIPFSDLNYFSHWKTLPPLKPGDMPDMKRLDSFRFCFGLWLCGPTVKEAHGFEVASVKVIRLSSDRFGTGRVHSLDAFPREAGETDDTARFRRAIAATSGGVLRVPYGVYKISSMLRIRNRCSLELNKGAVLRAVKKMSFVLSLDGRGTHHDYNLFLQGGVIDGNGLASCLRVANFAHFTLRDTTLLNGCACGLRVDGGYEVIANNVYFKCLIPGLAGNIAADIQGGDSHYTDCVAVDYTIGFRLGRGGSNRLTRCHVWGGPLPPAKPGEEREMLKNSICYQIGGSSAILRDCYADTGKIGYLVEGWDTRLLGCSYFNNKVFKLDDVTIIKHVRGRLLVTDGGFVKNMPHTKVYEGCGEVEWSNMMYSGFGPTDDCPGALRFQRKSATEQSALKLAE